MRKKTSEVIKTQKVPLNAEGARLPNLTITKFNGTYQAWLPFWKKYVAEVDSADLAPVCKFCKFKGIRPKVRFSIGQPFTNERYARAKNIQTGWETVGDSQCEYFKHHGFIGDFSANPRQIDEFYKTLVHNAQRLETMGITRRDRQCQSCFK